MVSRDKTYNENIVDGKLDRAENLAKEKHRHHIRKDERTLYWVHLESVVEKLRVFGISDEDINCAGWLHDTIEDTNTDYDELEKHFGQGVARLVAQVTKDNSLPEIEKEQKYVEKLSNASWEAQIIKLCDIWANLADLESGYKDEEDRVKQIKKKMKYFEAIKGGLAQNRDKIPNLDKGISEINRILSGYQGFGSISLPLP